MSSETGQQGSQTPPIKQPGWPMLFCPMSQIQDREVARIIKECKQESFWYRELFLYLLGGMLVTQGLISKGIFSASPRFGPFPKLAIAGVLGFAIGKMSYMGKCQKSFRKRVLHQLVHNKKGSVIMQRMHALAKNVKQNWDLMREKVQVLQQLSARCGEHD